MRCCRALLFPGEEDFGITPVEAMACGTPVIAFGRGGACETVVPLTSKEPTGVWFEEQSPECLAGTIESFETQAHAFSPLAARKRALHFNADRFRVEFVSFIEGVQRATVSPELKRAA